MCNHILHVGHIFLVYIVYLMLAIIHSPFFFCMVAPLYENKAQESNKHDVHSALKALMSQVAIAPNVRADLYAISSGFRPLAKGMTAKVQLLLTILKSHRCDTYTVWSSHFLQRGL